MEFVSIRYNAPRKKELGRFLILVPFLQNLLFDTRSGSELLIPNFPVSYFAKLLTIKSLDFVLKDAPYSNLVMLCSIFVLLLLKLYLLDFIWLLYYVPFYILSGQYFAQYRKLKCTCDSIDIVQ